MQCKVTDLSVVGLALVVVLISVSDSLAQANPVKGSGAGTFVTANFSYDGLAPAVSTTQSGTDTVAGPFTRQTVAESKPTITACTAPDSTAGLQFDLVAADTVTTFNTGQLYASAVASPTNHECVSNTTGSFGGAQTYTVNGGTGKYATATGTVTSTFTGQILTPSGAKGIFGAEQFTSTGSVTK